MVHPIIHARAQAFVIRITDDYLLLPEEFTPKDANVTVLTFMMPKGRECGIQRQVQVKHWVYGRTAIGYLEVKT